jgi:hypothetical protein
MRRWLLVVTLGGCHAGAGPVFAFPTNGSGRIGVEVSGGFGPLGARAGATTAVHGESQGRLYTTFDPAALVPLTPQKDDLEGFLGFGGSLGVAFGGDDGILAAGGWLSPFLWDDCEYCSQPQPVYSLTIGWRTLAGVHEIFIAPKVSALAF